MTFLWLSNKDKIQDYTLIAFISWDKMYRLKWEGVSELRNKEHYVALIAKLRWKTLVKPYNISLYVIFAKNQRNRGHPQSHEKTNSSTIWK